MPTPFMHLRAAHRFLQDSAISIAIRDDLGSAENLGAFLLGNVAPDARVSGGISRGQTHFFEYAATVATHPGEAMLTAHPELKTAQAARRAFVGGYIAHLSMDVVWAETMLFPHFYQRDWADGKTRYHILHVLLCYLDQHDYRQWSDRFAPALQAAEPNNWLPFLPDATLRDWRNVVAGQICEDCASETIAVLGSRVEHGAAGLQAVLEDEERMQHELWDHVTPAMVAEVEDKMYQAMTHHLVRYMTGSK